MVVDQSTSNIPSECTSSPFSREEFPVLTLLQPSFVILASEEGFRRTDGRVLVIAVEKQGAIHPRRSWNVAHRPTVKGRIKREVMLNDLERGRIYKTRGVGKLKRPKKRS